MSGAPKPTFLMPVYDAQELRRRMAVCFTIGELYRLAEKLGVPATPAWSNSPQDASRDIVRHFERSGALPFLVEALQEAKPLVEWPQPTMPAAPPPIAAPPSAPSAGAAAPGSTSFAAPVSAAFADAADDADAGGSPGDRPTPIATISAAAVFASSRGNSAPPAAMPPSPAGFAPAMMPRPGEAPPAEPASASGPGAPVPAAARTDVDGELAAFMAAGSGAAAKPLPGAPPSPPGPTPAWPGTVRAGGPPPAKAAPDYRVIAAAGAALLVGAVAIAFFVGRASSAATSDAGSTSDTAAPPPPGDHVALSQHVVGALGASLERVARDCQIDLGTLQGHSLFEVAYRRCGPPPVQAVAPQRPSYDPGVSGDPIDSPDPPRKARPTGGNKLQKVDATPAGPGGGSGSTCLSRCQQSHGACTSRCGAEPKQGSQYDAYQACLGGCLKAMSQCKMGCQ